MNTANRSCSKADIMYSLSVHYSCSLIKLPQMLEFIYDVKCLSVPTTYEVPLLNM